MRAGRATRAALCAVAVGACKSNTPAQALELVGEPLGAWRAAPTEAYARNLWDLQELDGRLYLGYGDAIANTGPTRVLAFDPASREFTQETILNEEAIFELHVFGGRLYVAGPDAVESPDGAVYVRDDAGWRTLPLPDVVHASDVLVHGDQLCVAVQDTFNGGAVRCSRDDGETWTTYRTGSFRAVSLFELGDALYVSSHAVGIQRVHSELTPVKLELEGVRPDADVLVSRSVHCGDELSFIAKQITYSGDRASVEVFGLFHAPALPSDVITASRVAVHGAPTDVFAKDGHCYALANRATDRRRYEVTIERSDDGRRWQRVVSITSDSLIRSAELMQGFFYLGTGCERDDCSAAAGRLLRIRAPR